MTAKWRGFLDRDLAIIHDALSMRPPNFIDHERADELMQEIEEEQRSREEDGV